VEVDRHNRVFPVEFLGWTSGALTLEYTSVCNH